MAQLAVLVIYFTALFQIFTTGIGLPVNAWILLASNIVLAGISYVVFEAIDFVEKKGRYLIWYMITALLLLFLSQLLYRGLLQIINAILDSIHRYYEIATPHFSVAYGSRAQIVFVLLAVAMLLLPLLWRESKKRQVWWVLVELLVFVVVLDLLVGQAPKLLPMAICMVCLLIYRVLVIGKKNLSLYGNTVVITSLIALMCCVVVISLVGQHFVNQRHNQMLSFQKRLETAVGISGFAGYTDGYLSNREPEKTHSVMLTAVASDTIIGRTFFRGFVGGRYDANRWKSAERDDFYSECKSVSRNRGLLSDQVMNQSFLALEPQNVECERSLTLYYPGVEDNYCYAPYFSIYNPIDNGLNAHGDTNYSRKENVEGYYRFLDPQVLSSGLYSDLEIGVYTEYVTKHYLEIPNDLQNTLADFLGTTEELPPEQAVDLVTERLHSQCHYETKLQGLSLTEDYVEHFLTKEKAGFCCHFATAATLLFRQLGVPARYVTGYAVEGDDFVYATSDEYICDIRDDSAHAWVEIYYAPVGWIPVEVTPGYEVSANVKNMISAYEGDEAQVNDTTKTGQEAKTEDADQTSATAPNLTTEQREEATTAVPVSDVSAVPGNNKGLVSLYETYGTWIRQIVILLVFLAMCCLSRYALRLYHRRQRTQENREKALKAIIKQLRWELKKKGIHRKASETDKDYLSRISRLYYNEEAAKAFYEVLQKYAYSKEPLNEEDLICAQHFFDSVIGYQNK